MKKKCISFFVTFLLVICLLPVETFAAENRVVYYDDGSYEVITITVDMKETRATGTKTGMITKDRRNSDGELEWRASMKATFTYDGSTSRCTSVDSPSVVIYDNTWSLDSKSCSKSGNTATGNITMAKKLLLGSGKVPITLTLSCDKNGNLS